MDDSFGPRAGSVYVSWIRVKFGVSGVEEVPVWFSSSADHGSSWSAPRPMSQEGPLNDKPQTVVDSAGRVYVVYENFISMIGRDRHADPALRRRK